MSFLSNLSAHIPFLKKPEVTEYFFALNIGLEKIKASLWSISNGQLKVINPLSAPYNGTEEILNISDRLLDQVLGNLPYEPEKILFGVPDSFLLDEEIKEPYLKLLRDLVKNLDIQPMAYVATSHAISHFLDKTEGGPTTAILVDVEKGHLSVSVSRAGKIDGTKVVTRGENLATDLEKALLGFTDIEVLPSKILIFGYSEENLTKQKDTLLSFPWMDKLPFLHFPKLDIIDSDSDIRSVAFAGAVEIDPNVKFSPDAVMEKLGVGRLMPMEEEPTTPVTSDEANIVPVNTGFVTGDIEEQMNQAPVVEETELETEGSEEEIDEMPAERITARDEELVDEFEQEPTEITPREPMETGVPATMAIAGRKINLPSWVKVPHLSGGKNKFIIPVAVILLLIVAFLILPQAEVTVFVEPKVLEKDTQVIADPKITAVDEEAKKIPGQVVETSVSGSDKGTATGKKTVGDSARGKVIIYNGTDASKSFSAGTVLTNSDGLKFTLAGPVSVASRSASPTDPLSTVSGKSDAVDVTASAVGADSNISSGSSLTVAGFSQSQIVAKAEGNFSGGTSKEVTVVTDADQKKLLASLAESLRQKAQGELQGKLNGKKILEEALSEEITKKTYNKNVNDQASEFTLNLTIKYKGIAYSDSDLKMIVAKLVDTSIPEGYQLDLSDTETQADVSKIENNQLVFLARFKAKLAPKLDLEDIKSKLRGQSVERAAEILRSLDNVLESEIKMQPALPPSIARLPLLTQRIKIEVKLK